ncbi:GH92 family glycosyl hydrolase [Maribacter ulvicola]|uniref:Alpha-1,2-mannosidase, putative n=1 Tax=Maribacter ulvicola TaxID=228959 RepID=A0A1N7AND9_9FLAO|nr:GH92 family glycosyl hydrolase [Maribacter ulvicola]SIR40565.1 alpha-1,2-mannosidase, putative [Maribacter ulvicola]
MFRYILPFLGLAFVCCEQPMPKQTTAKVNVLDHVDPFIGTGFHGHTFPGPVMPHGMVQLSPDTKLNGWDASSGYHYADSTIYGFSHTHLSGTGIGDMGDVLLLPFTGGITEQKPVAMFSKSNEHAKVGSYKVAFNNFDVEAELTATTRAGLHRYTFGAAKEKRVLLDVGHLLQESWGHGNVVNKLEIIDNRTIRGLKYTKGWADKHKVYFYAEFSSPFTIDKMIVDGSENSQDLKNYEGKDIFTYLSFAELKDDSALLIKVGISPIDINGAEKNLKAEVPHWNFDKVKKDNQEAWKKELERILITTSNKDRLTIFYTAMYHTMIAPMIYQDVDGRYRGMDKQIHTVEEGETNYTVYSLWDTFRALHPLMTIINEEKSIDWANNLLLKYEQGGLLPKWPLSANYTGTMIGYPATANLADILSKYPESIDKKKALQASLASAAYNPDIIKLGDEPRKHRLMPLHNKYINEGVHIPADKITKSISYGLENAYYDWCIMQLAKMSENDSIAAVFKDRSKNYARYFNEETGFMRGKNADGSWVTPFSPRYSEHEHSDYVEGNAWQWSWFVPHDVEGFVNLYGSKENFATKLDSLFTVSSEMEGEHISGDITGLIGQYAHGNEPSHHIAYLYNYIGQGWKTQEIVDKILNDFYTTQPDGIIGNEDCGQMSAWYILSSLGFYQVAPGNPTYTIGRPLFDDVSINLDNGKVFKIKIENNSNQNTYVQQIKLNGELLDTPFFQHDDIMNGGELMITMGTKPKMN